MDERIKFLRKAVNFAFDGLVETSLKIGGNGEGAFRKLKEFSTTSKSEAKRMVNEFAKEEKWGK